MRVRPTRPPCRTAHRTSCLDDRRQYPPGRREHLYPAWQFNGDGTPLASIPRVIRAGREAGLDEVELYEVLQRRSGLIGGRRLVDLLRDGGEQHVLAAVRAAGNGSAS